MIPEKDIQPFEIQSLEKVYLLLYIELLVGKKFFFFSSSELPYVFCFLDISLRNLDSLLRTTGKGNCCFIFMGSGHWGINRVYFYFQ